MLWNEQNVLVGISKWNTNPNTDFLSEYLIMRIYAYILGWDQMPYVKYESVTQLPSLPILLKIQLREQESICF